MTLLRIFTAVLCKRQGQVLHNLMGICDNLIPHSQSTIVCLNKDSGYIQQRWSNRTNYITQSLSRGNVDRRIQITIEITCHGTLRLMSNSANEYILSHRS
jgi:hypothetical protein